MQAATPLTPGPGGRAWGGGGPGGPRWRPEARSSCERLTCDGTREFLYAAGGGGSGVRAQRGGRSSSTADGDRGFGPSELRSLPRSYCVPRTEGSSSLRADQLPGLEGIARTVTAKGAVFLPLRLLRDTDDRRALGKVGRRWTGRFPSARFRDDLGRRRAPSARPRGRAAAAARRLAHRLARRAPLLRIAPGVDCAPTDAGTGVRGQRQGETPGACVGASELAETAAGPIGSCGRS